MRKTARSLLFLLVALQLVCLWFAAERPAYGYTDPGSGLLFLQILGSTVAGGLFMLRLRLRKFFGLGQTKEVETTPVEPTPEA